MSKVLNENCKYLISLIRSVLHGTEAPSAPDGIDYETLYAIAEAQGLCCMLYQALYKRGMDGIPEETAKKLRKTHMLYVQHSIMQEMEFYKISAALDNAGVDYMPLKGWYTRELYPEAVLRYMGDVDMLIRTEDSKSAYDAITPLGYTCEEFMRYDDDKYRKGGLTFELHRLLDSEGLKDASLYKEPFKLADNTSGRCWRMHEADAYVYTVVHAMKHFMFSGTGLRTLIDIYLYNDKGNLEGERGYISTCAEMLGVTKFMHSMEELAEKAFGSDLPFNGDELDEDSALLLLFMLKSGSGGKVSTLDLSLLDKSGKGGKGGSRATYIFRLIFPTLKSMQKRDPVLKKAPVLLPVMYVRRWIQLLFVDRSHIKESLDRYSAIDDAAVEELRHIHDIAGIEQ